MEVLYETRRRRLMDLASAEGIDCLIISDPVHILYFTGFHITPYERFVALILDTWKRGAHLILPSLENGASVEAQITKTCYEDHENPFERIGEILAGHTHFGVEKGVMPISIAEKIEPFTASGKAALKDITPFILNLRLCKTDDEIAAIEQAGQISDHILSQIRDFIQPGRSEKEITLAILQAMADIPDVGIDPFVIQILGGERGANPHGVAGTTPLAAKEAVTVDFGVCYRHYWSDCSRTFFIGDPPDIMKRIYPIVLQAQEAAIAAVRPGVPIAVVDATARGIIAAAGSSAHFIHRTGHGIGLGIHERPSVHGNNTALLEEGMVITVEPGIYLPGIGGVRIEDDVVVTADGHRVLTRYPKSFDEMILNINP